MCGYPVWFPIHFVCALATAIFSLSGFLVILGEKKWTWVNASIPVNFTHSILGAFGLGFCGLQVK
jgi:hypothetical protein